MGKKSKQVTEVTEVKKTRNRRPALQTMLAQLQRADKVLDGIEAKERAAAIVFAKAHARLVRWGRLDLSEAMSDTTTATIAHIEKLIAEGFQPPKSTRAPKLPAFAHGTPVRIKDEYAAKYLSLYSEVELHSMEYDFFDTVNKVVVCETEDSNGLPGRVILAKVKHLELRA